MHVRFLVIPSTIGESGWNGGAAITSRFPFTPKLISGYKIRLEEIYLPQRHVTSPPKPFLD
jgi:hypothetical protein